LGSGSVSAELTHYQYQRLAISAVADESRAFRQTFIAQR